MRDVNGNTGNSNRGNNNTNDDDDDKGFGDTMGPLNNNHLQDGDESTDNDSDTSEATQDP
jgi:hypothetical protein